MENKIDLSYSVAVDEATEKAMSFTADLCQDYGPDMVELALQRALLEIRDTKVRMYASVISNNVRKSMGNEPESGSETKSGTVDDLVDDLTQKGISVSRD